MSVNIDKTVVLVCKKGNWSENIGIFYDNYRLNAVTKFTYRGVTLSANGSFVSRQAMKALLSLYSLFKTVPLEMNDNLKIKLFDSIILKLIIFNIVLP